MKIELEIKSSIISECCNDEGKKIGSCVHVEYHEHMNVVMQDCPQFDVKGVKECVDVIYISKKSSYVATFVLEDIPLYLLL